MLSTPSMVLLIYGGVMLLAFAVTFVVSPNDARTIQDVGIWIKPMKFMAVTAIFTWLSVWVVMLIRSAVAAARTWGWIAAIGLVASQAWLAWEIWKRRTQEHSVITLAALIGLSFTFFFQRSAVFCWAATNPRQVKGCHF